MADHVRIEGLDGLLDTLRRMPPELIKGARSPVAFGLRRGGNVIRDEARARAPKASGYMARNIVTRRMSARQRRRAGADEYFSVGIPGRTRRYSNTKRNRGKGRVGQEYQFEGWAYYWRFLEFGTKKMKAKPFLTPAAEAKGPEAAKVIAEQIREGIDRIAKRHGWKG